VGRVLGVDFGSKRIGIAVSDAGESLASPLTVLERSGNLVTDHRRIQALVDEEEAYRVIVGLPVNLNGQREQAALAVLEEIPELELRLAVPVETWDERMTTAAAHKNLQAQNVSSKKRRNQIDKHAAAVMLQGWLDAQRLQGRAN
jgi:putative holliday junction resolvase